MKKDVKVIVGIALFSVVILLGLLMLGGVISFSIMPLGYSGNQINYDVREFSSSLHSQIVDAEGNSQVSGYACAQFIALQNSHGIRWGLMFTDGYGQRLGVGDIVTDNNYYFNQTYTECGSWHTGYSRWNTQGSTLTLGSIVLNLTKDETSAWHDPTTVTQPVQITCPSGTVYNVNTGKCEYTPSTQAVCLAGYTYNSASNKCEYTPSTQAVCASGYVYNSATNKCEYTPATSAVCLSGTTYNSATNKCEYTPSTQAVCPSGTFFNATANACQNNYDLPDIVYGDVIWHWQLSPLLWVVPFGIFGITFALVWRKYR